MHELSICLNIVNLVSKHVKNNKIKKIWLRVGELSGIEISALTFSFPIAARNTPAENAILDILIVNAVAKCNHCGVEVKPRTLFDACQECHSCDHELIQGNELQIIKVEID